MVCDSILKKNVSVVKAAAVAAACFMCVSMVTMSFAFSNGKQLEDEVQVGSSAHAVRPARHVVKRSAPSLPRERSDHFDGDVTTTVHFPHSESATGAIFTRWARTGCPDQSVSVYKGVMAGANSASTGGGTNYLCLPLKPEWSNIISGSNSYSQLFGVEFQGSNSLFFKNNANTFINQDAPCVVCQSQFRQTVLMIPALMTCLPGWHKEYSGFLMSAKVGEKSQKNFVCVDGAPELDPEGYRSDGGAKLWPVEALCGSLPCPNYEHGKELTCVVCTLHFPHSESATGAIFTRWARTGCPDQSVSVYKGVMAGANSASTGGGTDYLCLPLKPEWSNIISGSNSYSQLFGVEFQGSNSLFFKNANTFINQDAPCVVCQSQFRQTVLMIPALMTCLPGWHKEYSGFLMSAKVGEKSQKNFVCVDGAPELDPEGYRSDGGAKLWPVEALCGSLPCPNYEHGKELTCVVCTR